VFCESITEPILPGLGPASHGQASNLLQRRLYSRAKARAASLSTRGVSDARTAEGLRRPVPGRLFHYVKLASWIELCLFAGLLVVWIAPGLEHETFLFGMAHGIGFILLALLVLLAVVRHEAPYTLLAATLTPVGPVGSVIAIAWIERHPAS
jgi:hypothetical protein